MKKKFSFNNENFHPREFGFVEGEKYPVMMVRPYIYAAIKDYSTFFTVDNGKEIKIIEKG